LYSKSNTVFAQLLKKCPAWNDTSFIETVFRSAPYWTLSRPRWI
jgi:hypothetical protein